MRKLLALSAVVTLFVILTNSANASTIRMMTCSYTKLEFGSIPVVIGQFEFIEKPGYLPEAKGELNFSMRPVRKIHVNSYLVTDPDSGDESVVTNLGVDVGGTTLTSQFSNKIAEQMAGVQIGKKVAITCDIKAEIQ